MNAPFRIAQLDSRGTTSHPPGIRLAKPAGGKVIAIDLSGSASLDFTDIASEKITLVHSGGRLIILFDNNALIVLNHFYGADGQVLPNLEVELGSGRDVSGAEFATLFPITTDQSVLPAAGPDGGSAGASFSDHGPIDPLGDGRTPLDLLSGDPVNTHVFSIAAVLHVPFNTVPTIGTPDSLTTDEGALSDGNVDSGGNLGDVPGALASGNGSLHTNFGADLVGRSLSFSANQPGLAGLFSGGLPIALQIGTWGGLPALIGHIGNPADPVFVVTLDTGPQEGAYTFTLLKALDHPVQGVEDNLVLQIAFVATDGSGNQATGTFVVTVNDDSPWAHDVAASMGENDTKTIALVQGADYAFGADHAGATPIALGTPSYTDVPAHLTLGLPSIQLVGSSVQISPGAVFDSLSLGEQVTLHIPYTVTDGDGDAVTKEIAVTITGTNDAPVFDAAGSGSVNELGGTTGSQTLDQATGTLHFTDVDLNDVGHTASVTGVTVSGTTSGLPDLATLESFLAIGSVTKNAGSAAGTVDWTFSAADHSFDYLASGETATLTYTVAVDDHDGGTGTETVAITIVGSNDAPVIAAPGSGTVNEQSHTTGSATLDQATGTLHFTDADLNDVGHTAAVTGVTVSGTTSGLPDLATLESFLAIDSVAKNAGSAAGTIDWTFSAADHSFDYLASGETATLTYTVEVDDHHGGTGTETVNVTVTGTNDAPVIDTAAASMTYQEKAPASVIDAALTITDADSPTLSGATVSIATGFHAGEDILGFLDQHGITGHYDATTGVLTLSGGASVQDYQDALRSVTYANSSSVPSADTRTISYQVDDGAAADHASNAATATVTINAVNDAPVVHAPASITIAEDTPFTFYGANLLTVTDVDAGGSDVYATIAVTNGSLHFSHLTDVTIQSGSLVSVTGPLSIINDFMQYAVFTPDANFDGQAAITISIDDGGNTGSGGPLSASQTITINVTPVEDPPVAVDDVATTNEDTTLTTDAAHGVLANDHDPDAGDTLSVVAGDFATAHGSIHINADGSYVYTPAANFNGTDTVDYTVQDNHGETDTGTLSITVAPVNDPPAIHAPTSITIAEDTTFTFSGTSLLTVTDIDAGSGDISVTVTPHNGSLHFTSLTDITVPSGSNVSIDGPLSIVNEFLQNAVFTPDANFNGQATIDIYVDDLGNTGSGGALTTSQTITIDVTPVNDAPVTANDAAATNEDTTLTADAAHGVLANDHDPDAGDTLSVIAGDFITAKGGNIHFNADGSYVYTPAANFNGTDTVDYTAQDNHGATDTGTLSISVAAVNDAPVTHAPASITIAEGTSFTFAGIDAITVTDVDAGTKFVSTTLNWTHGSLYLPVLNEWFTAGTTLSIDDTVSDMSSVILSGLIFEADAGFTGQASLTVTTNDNGNTGSGGALTDTKTILIDVATSAGNSAATNEDTPLNVDGAHGVLANSDPAAALTVAPGDFTTAHGGIIHFNADGSYLYTPAKDFNGVDTVGYTVNGQSGGTSGGTLTITVAAVNDAPVVHAPTEIAVAAGGDFTFSGANAITVTDVDAGTKFVSTTLNWTHGSLYLPVLNEWFTAGTTLSIDDTVSDMSSVILSGLIFEADTGFTGQASLTVTTNDNGNTGSGGALTDTKTILIDVTPANHAPVITSTAEAVGVTEDESYSAPPQLISNGGFENYTYNASTNTYTIPGWTAGGNFLYPPGEAYGAHSGSGVVVFATSDSHTIGTYTSQAFTTIAGEHYTFDFWLAAAYSSQNAFSVSWGGQTLISLTNVPATSGYNPSNPSDYTHYSFDVIGTGSPTAVTFSFATDYYWFLDDVSVKPAYTPGTELRSGTIAFTDADTADHHTVTVTDAGNGYLGDFTWTLQDSTGGTTGKINWNFTVNDSDIQFLGANDTLTQVYHVTVDDGHGGATTQDVTVTIHGTNDAPVAVNDTLIIDGYSGTAPGTAASTPVINETAASNNNIASAQSIGRTALMIAPNGDLNDQSDPSVTVHGSLSSNSDKDYYGIALKAGETVVLDVDHTTGGLDSILRLYDSGGHQLSSNDDSSTSSGGTGSSTSHDSYLTYTITTDGTYYFDVESYNSHSHGNYDLQVSIDHFQGLTGTAVTLPSSLLLANDTDLDGDTLSLVSVSGTGVSLSGNDVIVQPGVTSFSYTVTDGHDQSTATVAVTQISGLTGTGTSGADILVGGNSADSLNGLGGNDQLFGGAGNDILVGGAGSDSLTGGTGSDIFKWLAGEVANGSLDNVLDFETGVGGDVLDLSNVLAGVAGNKADHVQFVYSDGFTQLASATGTPHAVDGDVTVRVNLSGSTWTDVATIHDTGPNLSAGDQVIQMMLDATQTAVHV